ncbi:hypothetical protein GOP47_0019909 [Adiantum capillus-veneris]|uniref:Uncharacterized protein n=1 Tax=Adiantum capillus-veneris TaxID=13818 RepID=A0A9D4Z866_ADICA|nr:hypothetical protein GOP47_0019909 [Adiantum capillus-veneris]
MGRQPCCEKEEVKKGPWSAEEDRKLVAFIAARGHGCWREVPKQAGLQRCGKSCRLRWINYLRPDLKRGMFSTQEESLIIHLHACYGNKWSKIASHLPGRTDNEIKNCWNTRIKKKLREMGVDPATHKPIDTVGTPESPSFIQRTCVKGEAFSGHLAFPHIANPTINAATYLNMLQEASLVASPRSVITTHATSSLSQTSPPTKNDDENSSNSTSQLQDHSISSTNVHASSTHEGLIGESQRIFSSQVDGKDGLQPHMLPISHDEQYGLHMHNYMLPNTHRHVYTCSQPMHMLQNEMHIHHALHSSQISHPMQHPPLALQVSAPGVGVTYNHLTNSPSSLKYEDEDNIEKGENRRVTSNNDVELKDGKDDDVYDIKREEDGMLATMKMSSRIMKDGKEGDGYAQAEEGNFGLLSVQGGSWSSMMLETLILANTSEGVIGPLVDEKGQVLGQENLAFSYNSATDGGLLFSDSLFQP